MTTHAESILNQIYSVDWTDVYDNKPLKYQRTTNTTVTLVVKY